MGDIVKVKIEQLPDTLEITLDDLFIIQQDGNTQKLQMLLLLQAIQSGLVKPEDIEDFVTEQELQEALDNLDLSGGGATEEEIPTTITVGNSEAGSVFEEGLTLTEYIKRVHQAVFNPTFVAPSFGLSRGSTSLYVIGSTANFTLTFDFDRGLIRGKLVSGVWNPNAFQDYRAGASVSYTIDGVTSAFSTLARSVLVAQGLNTFEATVSYAEGPQPVDSEGNPYQSPLAAGTSPVQSASFEGVYPLFASTVNITTATQLGLISMLSGNNIQINLIGESGGNKQFFEIPETWLSSRPLNSVQFFNTVSNQFDPTNQIGTFDVSDVVKTIEGNPVNYKRYTSNALDRGEQLIKLIF